MSSVALEVLVENMTLGELAARSGRTVEQIVGFALRTTSRPSPTSVGATKGPRSARGLKRVNTRTAAGRARYESALLEALKRSANPTSATELRAVAGGTAGQARATLNRLIDAGTLTFSGKARGTRYALA